MHMEIPSPPQRATSIVQHLSWVLLTSILNSCASVFIYDNNPNSSIDAFRDSSVYCGSI